MKKTHQALDQTNQNQSLIDLESLDVIIVDLLTDGLRHSGHRSPLRRQCVGDVQQQRSQGPVEPKLPAQQVRP